jgi:hypothetical protein
VDTDMGLIKTIQYGFHDTNVFYPGIMDTSEFNQQFALVTRNDPNPLSIIVKADEEDREELIKDLYNQFMEKEYDSILNLSSNTNLCNLAVVVGKEANQIIRITALCNSEDEEKLLKKRNINLYRTIIGQPEDIDISEYNLLFVKNVDDLDRYTNVNGKNIYIPNYGFNILMTDLDPNPLLPERIIKKYSGTNEFRIFTIYTFDPRKIPIG